MTVARRAFRWSARACLALGLALGASPAGAGMDDPLETRLAPGLVAEMFPGADPLAEVGGEPPLAVVRRGGEVAGWLFSTHEMVRPAGYAGNSFDIVVGLDSQGVIVGHRLLEEHEPLIAPGMIAPAHFRLFLGQLDGTDIRTTRSFVPEHLDAVSRATVSALIMGNAILDSAIRAGHLTGIVGGAEGAPSLDLYSFEPRSWAELIGDGAIATLTLTNGEVRAAFARGLGADAVPEPELGDDAAPFIILHVALATPPRIGRNLFGARAFRQISQNATPGEQQLLIASSGPYRWLPANPWLVPAFDRVRLVQGESAWAVRPENFYPGRRLAIADAPEFTDMGRLSVPADQGFDPLAPWALELKVFERAGAVAEPRAVAFALPYRLAARYLLGGEPAREPGGWRQAWNDKSGAIAGLALLLAAVSAVMLFQRRLTRRRRLYAAVRLGLLATTLVWLGWIAGAQLTILTVLAWLRLPFDGAGWRALMLDPLIVILAAYVALTLLLWGRGVFCGWLCPFGALQELINKAARLVRVPQVTVAEPVQRRLWAVKYVAAAGLVALAAWSMGAASVAAEIEPFKTAITLGFQRSWPYLAYAGVLLAAGLFIERFFCRYLCPLGALLAIGGKLHRLDWLQRRPECGNPCQICRHSCPVGAVQRGGAIDMDECLQCLDCQVDYHDDHKCPPLVALRKHAAEPVAGAPGVPA